MRRRAVCMRHGQSEYNVLGLCNDDPAIAVALTANGVRQVEATEAGFLPQQFELVIASELPRARQTAAIAMRRQQCALHIDPRLNDRRSGFEGRPVADYLAARDSDPQNFCAPGGETYTTLKARVLAFLDDLRRLPQREVLVVSHHEVLQVLRGQTLGWSDDDIRRWWIEPGSCFEFGIDPS